MVSTPLWGVVHGQEPVASARGPEPLPSCSHLSFAGAGPHPHPDWPVQHTIPGSTIREQFQLPDITLRWSPTTASATQGPRTEDHDCPNPGTPAHVDRPLYLGCAVHFQSAQRQPHSLDARLPTFIPSTWAGRPAGKWLFLAFPCSLRKLENVAEIILHLGTTPWSTWS